MILLIKNKNKGTISNGTGKVQKEKRTSSAKASPDWQSWVFDQTAKPPGKQRYIKSG